MTMPLTSSPPMTLAQIVSTGMAWDIEPDRNRYKLTYHCPDTLREQTTCYTRERLCAVDKRLPSVLHVLSENWSGKSIQNGLVRTTSLWAALDQKFSHKDQEYQWDTWESLAIEKTSENYFLTLRTYELLDHSTPYLRIANPNPAHITVRISSTELEKQYPGIRSAIETSSLGELSGRETAQYCLAALGYPNTLYPEIHQKITLPALPEDLAG